MGKHALMARMPRTLPDHRSRVAVRLREAYLSVLEKHPEPSGKARRLGLLCAESWVAFEDLGIQIAGANPLKRASWTFAGSSGNAGWQSLTISPACVSSPPRRARAQSSRPSTSSWLRPCKMTSRRRGRQPDHARNLAAVLLEAQVDRREAARRGPGALPRGDLPGGPGHPG